MKQTVWMYMKANDATPVVRTEKPTLAEMQAAVGGWIEYAVVQGVRTFPFPLDGEVFDGKVIDVIVNEEGLLHAEPSLNVLATLAAYGEVNREQGLFIVGDAIVVLEYDTAQEPLTHEQVDAWKGTQLPNRPEREIRTIEGFVPVSEPRLVTPDFDADGDDAQENRFEGFHGVTVDNIAEAAQFYHALIFTRGVVIDPTKGFLTPHGFTAYTGMTHTDARELNRINNEAVAHMEKQGIDSWTVCANMVMAAQLSVHLQENMVGIGKEHFPFHAAEQINKMIEGDGGVQAQPLPANTEDYAQARAHFALDRITEWCAITQADGFGIDGQYSAGLVNAVLLPLGWSEWVDDLAATLGGRTGMLSGQDPEEVLQRVVDDAERAAGHHDDPDDDDNDDDPFKGVDA